MGSVCKMYCQNGFIPEPGKNITNVCKRGGWEQPTHTILCKMSYCQYPTYEGPNVVPVNLTEAEGVDYFGCTDVEGTIKNLRIISLKNLFN